jgi:hypothetical protein
MVDSTLPSRSFKTAWFAKAARRAKIGDATLCKALAKAMAGQADDLGGGVYKKRLANNQYRSIILAKGLENWVYVYLFAKQDRANIDDAELRAFRRLAALYGAKTGAEIEAELTAGELTEICT